MALFNLSEERFNVLKAQAKKAINECSADSKANGHIEKRQTAIISKYYKPIKPLVSPIQFIWFMGYLNRRWGTTQDWF